MLIKNDTLCGLEKQYSSVLQDYLAGRGETALEHAYELGRKAIADRLGILDMAAIHQRALVRILPRTLTPQESSETIKKAAQFFAESLAPFEMTFRGFQESIAELHNLNRTLEQSEMKFRSVVKAANDAIISADSNGNIISWNRRAQTIFGYTEEEALGKSLSILIPERCRAALSRELEKFRGTDESKYIGKTLEFYGLRKDGSEFPTEISIASWKTGEGKFITGIVRDITERKKAEQALREAHAYSESIVETLRESLVVLDPQLRVKTANKTFYKTFKVLPEETLNKFIYDIGDRQWDIPRLRELLEEIIPRNTHFSDFEVDYEFPTIGRRTMILNARRLHQTDVDTQLILLAIEDITERKKLEAQILRTQRMESIGTLAGGIAHDLNNMMTPMMLSLQILKEKFKDEQSQKLLAILEQNSKRAAELIKQVLSFARGVEGERKPLQVTDIVSEIEKVMKETFPRNIDIRADLPGGLSTISGDVTQLHQVIMNLCVNARDAMPDGGILSTTASNIFIDENYARMNTEAREGLYCVITVSDTGTGIPPEILDRIFEPFFTTKEFGKGTGLGLSTAHAIVKSHGGFINVYSEVGKGTTFKVYLPAIRTELEKVQEHKLELPSGHGELILVVEDEASISKVTCSTLEMHGYKVLTADDGAQAVALYAQNKDKISVVLMDIMMPVMDGHASIKAIHRINPGARIIATSGLSEKDKLMKATGTDINAFLPKPYTAEQLLKTIHKTCSRNKDAKL
ncbi:PAS domain S-box protein [Candidatus Methanoperedens nitratireducens]|uniref:PAS/PAC sensor hybrid histidine kinase n=1 Tax=Candidatus Methanoperedens nitratireducens TaxID=1392998 RepID=A0A284VT34_9EURY|nr:PAS domain S-box protein [Candidatus Methanoperedens nitroreducens]SNQ62444.1 PAS/PAC sensor hybrid histidine kinase [Candidatus Methanoperedens nitroreducens]